jgi:hypothetical protein
LELLFIIVVPLVVSIWLLVTHLDKERVSAYLSERGNRVMSIRWRLFGRGWISEASKDGGGNRIYEVEYEDLYGAKHHVWVKTAMLSGVFLSEDEVLKQRTGHTHELTPEQKIAYLEEELRRTRSGG